MPKKNIKYIYWGNPEQKRECGKQQICGQSPT